MALGGGAHYKTMCTWQEYGTGTECKNDCVGTVLLICGDSNVNVASVGLFDSKITASNEEKLRLVTIYTKKNFDVTCCQ